MCDPESVRLNASSIDSPCVGISLQHINGKARDPWRPMLELLAGIPGDYAYVATMRGLSVAIDR